MMQQRLDLRQDQQQVCATCKGSASGPFVTRPIDVRTREVHLIGCVILGLCPACSRSGMDDDAIAAMLRRLDRPKAPMRFARQQVIAAQSARKGMLPAKVLRTMAIEKTATISEDGVYRYNLTRTWCVEKGRVLFVMLNPSTADAKLDDPTIRKCMGFAARWGYGGIEVVNLYARRSTDPSALWSKQYQESHESIEARAIGPDNDAAILAAAQRADRVVAAWGSEMRAQGRARHVLATLARLCVVHALKVTIGPPWHPLYVPYGIEPAVLG